MKALISILFIACFTLSSQSQIRSSGAFSLGWQNYSTAGLSVFDPAAPGLSEQAISSGGYGAWTFGHWMIGFKGAGFWGRERMRNPYRYALSGGYFSLEGGYEVIQSEKNYLTALAGLGIAGVNYSIENSSSPDLTAATLPVVYSGSYNWGALMIDLGLRYERAIERRQKSAQKSSDSKPFLGLEAGYLFTPGSDQWRTNGGSYILNAPEYRLGSIYARVTLGGMSTYLKKN